MAERYTSKEIEVLTGLDPVKKRPGMYTVTARPDHIFQEVLDNSVDEAMAGHADEIRVTHFKDGSMQIIDNGRGMPTDIHPEHKLSGVELILTRLHAGAKFSDKSYKFSGGLHGVGVSVVNALSKRLEVEVKRGGHRYTMAFKDGGLVAEKLKEVGEVKPRDTGTHIRFWPDPQYFDSPKFLLKHCKHVMRAKAVLCPGLTIHFHDEVSDETITWYFESGPATYLTETLQGDARIPDEPFTGAFASETETVDWACIWLPEGEEGAAESYVNLIPTIQGGTHVNGLRLGLLEALREFCDIRNLLPRGVKLAPEDVWEHCRYVLSVKIKDPQFSGQTKERLTSRQCATFVSGVVKDAFSLWLNKHTEAGEALVELILSNAQKRMRKAQKVARKQIAKEGPPLPGKLADCSGRAREQSELFLVEGDSAGGSAKQARDREFQAVMPLRGKILNTWEIASDQILASQEVHDIAVAVGVDPASDNLSELRYGKVCILADADSDGAHIATLLCALFMKHFPALVKAGAIYVAMPPLYRIDMGKKVFYALDDDEKQGILDRLEAEKQTGKLNIQRFKGLGEMNPLQLRETTMAPETRRLVQLTLEDDKDSSKMMDKLLGKKRASDRRTWLETKGNLAQID